MKKKRSQRTLIGRNKTLFYWLIGMRTLQRRTQLQCYTGGYTGRLRTRERDPGNKLVRRVSGAEPAEDPESKGRRVCIFAINKRIFKSFLLEISRRVSVKVSLILNTFFSHHTSCLLNRVTTKKAFFSKPGSSKFHYDQK